MRPRSCHFLRLWPPGGTNSGLSFFFIYAQARSARRVVFRHGVHGTTTPPGQPCAETECKIAEIGFIVRAQQCGAAQGPKRAETAVFKSQCLNKSCQKWLSAFADISCTGRGPAWCPHLDPAVGKEKKFSDIFNGKKFKMSQRQVEMLDRGASRPST